MPSLMFKIFAASDRLPGACICPANEQDLGFKGIDHNQNRLRYFESRILHSLFILHELCPCLEGIEQLPQKHL